MSFFLAGFFCFVACSVASITIIPATLNLPQQYRPLSDSVSSDLELFLKSYPQIGYNRPKLTENNATKLDSETLSQSVLKGSRIYPSRDSFVQGAINAWTQNQHFVIRPEDVWFTILQQLNFYLSSHKNDSHVRDNIEYKARVVIDLFAYIGFQKQGDRVQYNFSQILGLVTRDRLKKRETYSWLQSDFSTTKYGEDAAIAALLLTSPVNSSATSYQAQYRSPLASCGMPSITLMGNQEDWKALLQKLDRLPIFGAQPAEYGEMLYPILSRFVTSFEDPTNPDVRQFWDTIVRVRGLRGEGATCLTGDLVSGWVNGFHYWDTSGRILAGSAESQNAVRLNGVQYPFRGVNNLPHGYTNTIFGTMGNALGEIFTLLGDLTAGMVGENILSGAPEGYAAAMQRVNFTLPPTVANEHHSMLQPVSRWLLINGEPYMCGPGMMGILGPCKGKGFE